MGTSLLNDIPDDSENGRSINKLMVLCRPVDARYLGTIVDETSTIQLPRKHGGVRGRGDHHHAPAFCWRTLYLIVCSCRLIFPSFCILPSVQYTFHIAAGRCQAGDRPMTDIVHEKKSLKRQKERCWTVALNPGWAGGRRAGQSDDAKSMPMIFLPSFPLPARYQYIYLPYDR